MRKPRANSILKDIERNYCLCWTAPVMNPSLEKSLYKNNLTRIVVKECRMAGPKLLYDWHLAGLSRYSTDATRSIENQRSTFIRRNPYDDQKVSRWWACRRRNCHGFFEDLTHLSCKPWKTSQMYFTISAFSYQNVYSCQIQGLHSSSVFRLTELSSDEREATILEMPRLQQILQFRVFGHWPVGFSNYCRI